MGKVIKMIWTSTDNCLFLYGINQTGEVVFRTSRNIRRLQIEKPVIHKELCYIGLYYIHINDFQELPILN